MHKEVKEYADNGDLTSLKYIFVDALDVDPTFVRYKEDYEYCKSIPGLLEPYIELTPFTQDQTKWNAAYWAKLKVDLLENFSDKRMSHMCEVAKVFMSEKVQRILAERASKTAESPHVIPTTASKNLSSSRTAEVKPQLLNNTSSKAAEEEKRLQEARQKLEEENRIAAQKERDTYHNVDSAQISRSVTPSNTNMEPQSPKKVLGIVAVAAVVLMAIIILAILK